LFILYQKKGKIMAIFIDNKLLFIHVPRTGGEWLEKNLEKNNIYFLSVGNKHDHACSNQAIHDMVKDVNSMVFLRHPAEWYKSHWELKMHREIKARYKLYEEKSFWHPTWDIDNECISEDFEQFVENCLNKFPSFVSYLYDQYTRKPPVSQIDNIFLTRELDNQLPQFFQKYDIDFKIKVSNFNSHKDNNALYSEKLLYKVLKSESRSIGKFNFSSDINKLEYLLKKEE